MTLQGWTGLKFNYMDSYGNHATAFFFVFFILFCSKIMLNLVLAVIIDAFGDNAAKLEDLMLEKEKQEEIDEMERFKVLEFYLRLNRIREFKVGAMNRCKRKYSTNGDIKLDFFDVVAWIVYEKRI